MEDRQLSETAKNIVSQAQSWNFEGDCMILQWMQQISQNLETRAKTTTESLDKVTKNLGRAQIALENTQNSLNALQYTQYVEMRCQEDELAVEPENIKDEVEEKSKKDILKEFLQNNLKMLHNCHDKFNFLEDSDEDDMGNVASAENCIYQPRNPYNQRLLPHIFGTKMWKENWHIGLCDDSVQNYSGDETSDVYSLSSSSCGENESMESHNTENLSQWTSSVSLNNENSNNSNKIGNFVPTVTSMLAPTTTLDLPVPKTTSNFQSAQAGNSNSNKMEREVKLPNFDATENIEPSSSSTGTVKKKALQCKTLNLFDDNDFESLMSEITDKAQAKQNTDRSQGNVAKRTERVSAEKPKADLFASRSNSPIAANPLSCQIKADTLPQANQTLTPKISNVNLFDSPTDDFLPIERFEQSSKKSQMDLFEDLDDIDYGRQNILKDSALEGSTKIENKTMISAKSLFDDDDGDEDFLNIFGKSKTGVNSTLVPKTSSRIANWHEKENINVKQPSTVVPILLFDDNDDDFSFSQKNNAKVAKEVEEAPKDSAKKVDEPKAQTSAMAKGSTAPEKPRSSTKNIFLDESDDQADDFIFTKGNQNKSDKKVKDTNPALKEANFEKQTDLPNATANKKIEEVFQESAKKNYENLTQEDAMAKGNIFPVKTPIAKRNVFLEESDDDKNDFIFAKDDLNNSVEKVKAKASVSKEAIVGKQAGLLSPAEKNKVAEVPQESVKIIKENLTQDTVRNVSEKTPISTLKNIFLDESDADENDFIFTKENQNKSAENVKDTSSLQKEANFERQTDSRIKHNDFTVFEDFVNDRVFEKLPAAAVRTSVVGDNKPFRPITAFMDLEPPEDTENQYEKQFSTTVNKSPKLAEAGDMEDDFFNLFASTKSKPKDKVDIFGDVDLDDPQKTIPDTAMDTKTSTENDFNINREPTELTGKNSSSIVSTNSPSFDNTAIPTIESPGNAADISSNEISQEVEATKALNKAKVISTAFEKSHNDELQVETPDFPSMQISREIHQAVLDNIPPDLEKDEVISNDVNKVAPQTPDGDNLNKPPVYDYSPLFLDEPPDDDDFFQTVSSNVIATQSNLDSDFYEATSSIETKTEDPAHKPSGYNIGLFSDVPPEDEDIDSLFKTSTNNTVLSISKTQQSDTDHFQAASNLDLIPPADIFESKPVKGKDEQDHQAVSNTKSVLSKLTQAKDTPTDIPPKTTVSKLKMPSININVQALLPNAGGKPRNSNMSKTAYSSEKIPPAVEIPKSTEEVIINKETPAGAAGRENILPSLCKNRVRGPLNRKASTRAGRQKNYEKSLENEQREEQVIKSTENKSRIPNSPSPAAILKANPSSHEKTSHSIAKSIHSSPLEAGKTLSSGTVKAVYPTHTDQEQSLTKPQKSTGSKLFDGFDQKVEDDDDFFSSLIKTQSSKKVEQKTSLNVPKPMHIATDSDDDLFTPKSGAIQKIIQKPTSQPTKAVSVASKAPKVESQSKLSDAARNVASKAPKVESQSKKSAALFASDSNDEDDDLFRALNKPKAPVKVSTNIPKEAKGDNKSLFSEDDDDDLFSSSAAKTKKVDSTIRVGVPVNITLNTQPLTQNTKVSADNPLADLLDS